MTFQDYSLILVLIERKAAFVEFLDAVNKGNIVLQKILLNLKKEI